MSAVAKPASFMGRLGAFFGGKSEGSAQVQKAPPLQYRTAYPRLTDWLPYTSYHKNEGLFVLEAKNPKGIEKVDALGFAFELIPPAGMSPENVSIFSSIVQSAPVDACMQLHLFASNDLTRYGERMVAIREPGLYRTMAQKRFDYFEQLALAPRFKTEPYMMRQFRLILSASAPCSAATDSSQVEAIFRWKEEVANTIRAMGLYDSAWDATDLIRFNAIILNPQLMFTTNRRPRLNYDRGRLVRSQIVDSTTLCEPTEDGQTIRFSQPGYEPAAVRTFSVRSYPDEFDVYSAASLIGDFNQTNRAYSCPYLITVGWKKPDFEARKNVVNAKSMRAQQKLDSPMARFMPELKDSKRDWNLVQQAYASGSGDVQMYHQIVLFSPEEEMTRAETNAKSVWQARDFEIAGDTYMGIQGLLSSLPMSLTPTLATDIARVDRFSTKTVDNVIHTAPMIVEWTGLGDPIIPLAGRRGQVGGVDLFANPEGNYNFAISGASGSGKSVFCNEIVAGYLGTGAKVWVVDVGRSYEKLCARVGGEYLEFKSDSPICINPFPLIRNLEDDMDMIQPLVCQMASGASGSSLSTFQTAAVGKAIRLLYERHGQNLTITHFRDLFKSGRFDDDVDGRFDKELSDISTQLDKYALGGAYARYFEGIPSIDFSNDFIVLELEELKNKKDLGSVVLLIMMYRITEEMYRMGRERRKVVLIDEAYDLLSGGQAAKEFIGSGYRRARKYNGAFGTATQGINDYYANEASTAALENADWQFILRQKEETIAALAKSDRLVMGEAMKRVLLSMRKVDGEYSEVFVKCPVGQGLMRFIVDPHSLLLYSSKGEDFIAIKKLRDQGMSIEQAVEQVLADRAQLNQGGQRHG